MIHDKNKYSILIVEDNEGDFIIIEDHLTERMTAPVIIQAKNAAEAEEIINSASIPFDVIMLDLRLPDESGQALITHMLQLAGETPIVILTGFSDFSFSVSTITQGISDYLSKDDLNAATLYKSIIYAIERKKMMSEVAESEKRFSDLFNLSPQAMWVFDLSSLCFLAANKTASSLLEYSNEELLRLSVLDIRESSIMLGKGKEKINLRMIGDFDKKNLEYFKKSGNSVTLNLYTNLITFRGKRACFVTAVDVTEKLQEENKITRAIINTQEKERSEMGRELHDNVCQILAAGRMNLDMLKPSIAEDKKQLFEESISNIKLAADEIRNLSHRLAPAFYDISDLRDAIFTLVKTYNPAGGIKFSINLDEDIFKDHITRDIQLNMYRILQEQLGNIIKHARATAVEIDLSVIKSVLEMRIKDNGIGFDPEQKRNGIGLGNIKKRAELFGGAVDLISSPGKGSTIQVHIPVKKKLSFPHNNLIL